MNEFFNTQIFFLNFIILQNIFVVSIWCVKYNVLGGHTIFNSVYIGLGVADY